MKDQSTCYFRGFLGNQVIQSALGYALALKDGHSVDFVFSSRKANSKLENANTIFSKEYLSILFKLDQKIRVDQQSLQKTPYWWHGAAKTLYDNKDIINEKFSLKKKPSPNFRSYVHIRATDKQSNNNLSLYSNLIRQALRYNRTVFIVGDNKSLLKELATKFSNVIYEEDGGDEITDWYKLLGASQIYCSASTFPISTLFFGFANINIINPSDFTKYPHYLKEYTFIYELSKYFGQIKILEPLEAPSMEHIKVKTPKHSFIDKLPSSYEIHNNMFEKKMTKLFDNDNNGLNSNANELEKMFLDKKSLAKDTEDALNEFVELFDLSNSYMKDTKNKVKSIIMSSRKNLKDSFIPPILEEYGLSIRRHYIKNMHYILNQKSNSNNHLKPFYSKTKDLFMRDGFICLENFIPNQKFKEVQEYFSQRELYSLSKKKNTLLLKSDNEYLKSIFFSQELVNLLCVLTNYNEDTIRKELTMNTFFQEVILAAGAKKDDIQQNFHLDTYYPAFKFWYFPCDVTVNDAPFEYVKYSHLPSKELYTHYHQNYLDNIYGSNYAISEDNREGSLRITPEKIRRLGYKPIKVTAKANTLIIANVGGLHRRSIHKNDVRRIAIHSSIRPDFGINK